MPTLSLWVIPRPFRGILDLELIPRNAAALFSGFFNMMTLSRLQCCALGLAFGLGLMMVMPQASLAQDSPAAAVKTEPAFQGLIPPAGTGETAANISYGGPKPDGADTHPRLNLTPDKSELVRLEQDAGSIIVGNPDHLGVMMDNRKLLILVPRQPGATYLTVLDGAGKVIMQRHVIVASPKNDYIRIRRSCRGPEDCEPTSVYYCPGMCHPVGLVRGNTADVPDMPAGAPVAPPALIPPTPAQDRNPVEDSTAPPPDVIE